MLIYQRLLANHVISQQQFLNLYFPTIDSWITVVKKIKKI